ncbi:unnamed protein product [Allacma fusca]|uniref:G-protein coupled receptors family 1 profile domain-containing protein n=1 Tax=Allacma fusca TaxID=39272 RepID=A0A8J2PUC6_9HEXA|nr:unnamed protein product [Allacma fusca]
MEPAEYQPIDLKLTGVGVTIITIVGVMGNTLSAIVLYQPKMRSSVTLLLLGLTFCDTTFLITLFVLQGLRALVFDYFLGIRFAEKFFGFLTSNFFIVSSFALTGSYYFTMATTLDRYVAVWWPLKARHLCTWSRARYVAAVVVLISITYPTFSNLYIVESPESLENRTRLILSKCGEDFHVPKDEASKFIDASFESDFLSWPYLIIMMLFPFTTLVVFNSLIYVKVRQANKTRKNMTSQENTDISYAVICVMITVLFLSCNSALITMAVLMRFYNCKFQQWKSVLISVDTFLVSVNSSSNFIIYCTMGTRFRRQLKRVLSHWSVFSRCFPIEPGLGGNISMKTTRKTRSSVA